VATGVHYPVALHQQPALQGRVRVAGDLTGAERIATSALSLPVYPELTDGARVHVIDAVTATRASRAAFR
jgi:dTDP-4-amino-4,6-dideoxygalactose transaminase